MSVSETYKNNANNLTGAVQVDEARRVSWQCPSNIALIKYWGKRAVQLPMNPSLSFTLRQAFTETSIDYRSAQKPEPELHFSFEGKKNTSFGIRVASYIKSLYPFLPFIAGFDLRIDSKNTFPHSSGIASSASSMGALALCLTSMEKELFGTLAEPDEFFRKASFLARMGSGSAARSVFGGFVLWGADPSWKQSSDEFAVPLEVNRSNKFWSLNDAILITSREKKKISSSAGHKTMDDHPFAAARYAQARENLRAVELAISREDEGSFIRILEQEALSLHAMMLSAGNGYTLLNEHSWSIIRKIRDFREKTGTFATFTLDAGPNVHFIYKKEDLPEIEKFIRNDLVSHCEQGHWINDGIGEGPEQLNIKQEVGVW